MSKKTCLKDEYWWCEIPFNELTFCTQRLYKDPENPNDNRIKLGKGSYGSVYKGKYIEKDVEIKEFYYVDEDVNKFMMKVIKKGFYFLTLKKKKLLIY